MRILYVTNESPVFPVGGIAVYVRYAARAMAQLGHSVFLLTWTYSDYDPAALTYDPFAPDNVRIFRARGSAVWRQFPKGPFNVAFSKILAGQIEWCVREWAIDVVEATDYLGPGLDFFQQLQASRAACQVLCVSYNHGLNERSYEAARMRVADTIAAELAGERQQCRASDLVIAPSETSRRKLEHYGIRDNVEVVREPFPFTKRRRTTEVNPALTHLGRVAIAKGIDRLILLANILHSVTSLERLALIGKIVDTPYRTADMQSYIRQRLTPELRAKVVFMGDLPRDVALSLLIQGDITGSLSISETFCYSFVESLDRGLLPIVEANGSSHEFYPPELSDLAINFRRDGFASICAKLEQNLAAAESIIKTLQDYNAEQLAPARIAAQMNELFERRLWQKREIRSCAPPRAREHARVQDVTVLMPIFRPNAAFCETIESLASQSASLPRVIICDDGTPANQTSLFDYAAISLPDITIIRQPNLGLLGARSTLIDHCCTKLAVFLDGDDILPPNFLQTMLDAYNFHPARPNAVLPERHNFFENNEKVIRANLHDHTHILDNDFRMTALIEAHVLRDIRFDISYRNGEADDWAFWLEFTARGYRGVVAPRATFQYRFQSGSMSWPWSEGQAIGTHVMVRDAVREIAEQLPLGRHDLVEATYAAKVRLQ